MATEIFISYFILKIFFNHSSFMGHRILGSRLFWPEGHRLMTPGLRDPGGHIRENGIPGHIFWVYSNSNGNSLKSQGRRSNVITWHFWKITLARVERRDRGGDKRYKLRGWLRGNSYNLRMGSCWFRLSWYVHKERIAWGLKKRLRTKSW